MSFKTQNTSFSLAFLITLVSSITVEAQPNPLCATTDDPAFCAALVKSAKTPKEATTNAIQASLLVVKRAKSVVDGVASALPADLSSESKESMITTCNSNYEDVVDNLTGALEDLKKGDKASLITKLSASCLSDCVDGFEQFNASDPAIKKAQEEFNKYTEYCLIVSKQI